MLEFLGELVFDGCELGDGEGGEVDCSVVSAWAFAMGGRVDRGFYWVVIAIGSLGRPWQWLELRSHDSHTINSGLESGFNV